MSTETQSEDDDLRERIENFLRRNFPQIQMHGGSAAIRDIDREEGSVTIMLGGACSGCGISPMTIQAIKSRMVSEIPEIEQVHAETGMGGGGGEESMSPSFPGHEEEEEASGGRDEGGPSAPF
jgi:Fe-S cluster biogenesis protein NfuA